MQKAEKFSFFVIHKHIVKHMITLHILKLFLKKFLLFFLQCIRMSQKNINFDDKKILKKRLLQKQKSNHY